ncbi:hypothetical protein [Spirosoma aerolatum]|uniref:hypothetical protein n=1 Tax=Spirosoma aerolatum TaxID=1211326 RepID=UPI0009ADE596|nr:hypothetical protein [Spirosoma aerolatum]
MLEFVFKKSELKNFINESPIPDEGNVVVRLKFDYKVGNAFPARVTAFCEQPGQPVADPTSEIDGCPRPPGCD